MLTTEKSTPVAAPAQARDRLSWTERIGYGFGDVGSCLYFGIFMNFLAYYYTDVYGLSAAAVGTMIFVVRTYDWIKDPIMGVICDRTRSSMGRYRPWLVWMIIPYMVMGVLTFTTFDLSPTGKLVYAYSTYILLTLVYTMINVPFSALMGVMTPNSEERTVLSSFRMIGGAVGSMIVYGTMLPLVAWFGQGNAQKGFSMTVGVYALLAAGAFLFTFFATKERVQPPVTARISLGKELKLLGKNGPWLVLIVVSLLATISMGMRSGATLYYFKYVAQNEQLATGFFIVGSVVQIIAVSFTSQIARVFGGKKPAYIGLFLIVVLLSVAFYFIPAQNYTLLMAHQVVMTMVVAPIFALFWSMIADCANYGLWKLGQSSTGLLFSAGTFSQKIGWSIAPALSLWALGYFGFEANQVQSEATIECMRILMSIAPAVVALVTVGVALFYRIDGNVEREIEAGLRAMERA